MPRKYRKTHYKAFILPDGTAIYAVPARKPRGRRPDADGVVVEYPVEIERLQGAERSYVAMVHTILSTRINFRRALRELIEPRLTRIEAGVADLRRELHDRMHAPAAPSPDDA
jgi:hypothetical protein